MIPTASLAQLGISRVTRGLDSYWSDVSLLLHCDGSDGSTTITDSSSHARTMAPVGATQIDTAQSKFGGASVYLDGVNSAFSTDDDTELQMGSGNFTLELFARLSSVTGTRLMMAKQSLGTYAQYMIQQTGGLLEFYASSNNSSYDICGPISGGSLSADTWYHVAVTRSGTSFRLFLDGTEVANTTSSASLHSTATALTFGLYPSGTGDYVGWMDEIRITKGVARYTANFTPPTEAFPNS